MREKKSNKITFGIIGYGSIGKVHTKNLKKMGYKFIICDPKIDNTEKKYLKKISLINETCSCVIIASPSNKHHEYLNYFIKRKNIFSLKSHFLMKLQKQKKF